MGRATPIGYAATKDTLPEAAEFAEIPVSADMLAHLLGGTPDGDPLEQWRGELWAQIAARLLELLPTVCTDRQYRIISMWLTGRYTQQDIADTMSISQTSVHKSIYGNTVYSGPFTGRTHGGIIRKLQLVAARDQTIVALRHQLANPPERNIDGSWTHNRLQVVK